MHSATSFHAPSLCYLLELGQTRHFEEGRCLRKLWNGKVVQKIDTGQEEKRELAAKTCTARRTFVPILSTVITIIPDLISFYPADPATLAAISCNLHV